MYLVVVKMLMVTGLAHVMKLLLELIQLLTYTSTLYLSPSPTSGCGDGEYIDLITDLCEPVGIVKVISI